MASRYLIVQLADIGDLVLSTPAIAALRDAQPDAHIALLTTTHSAPVVAHTGLVDTIITLDRQQFNSSWALLRPANLRQLWALRREHCDTLLFFHHFTLKLGTFKFALIAACAGSPRRVGLQNGNGWFLTDSLPDGGFGTRHQAQYWLDLVGLVGADSSPRPAIISVDDRTGTLLGRPYRAAGEKRIVLHPGSGGYSFARRWDAEKFAAVADTLHEQDGAQIVLVGSPNDDAARVKAAMNTEPLDLSGKTTLPELAAVIQSADLYIGADSGVTHIAAAVGTSVVAIFGPSNAGAWGPWTPKGKSVVLRSAPECSPCSYVGHGIGQRDGCAARTCMRMVTAEQVVQAARRLLNVESVRAMRASPLQSNPSYPHHVRILGLPVAAITYDQWLTLIGEWIAAGDKAHHVCTVNPEFMMVAQKDAIFRVILQRADLNIPDGVGLLWAARWLSHPLPERVTGSDGVARIAERAAQTGWQLFFLGAAPGVAERAADVLRTRFPGVQIVDTYAGSPALGEEDAIVARINAAHADILFVAYGAPEQDKWIARNLPRLKIGMAMGVGGAFDFIAGIVPRAPMWMQRLGLEWLFRLIRQPWRARRMLRLPQFVLAVLWRGEG